MEFLKPSYIKNRISREFGDMSRTRKIVYAVTFVVLIAGAVLLLSGVWQPFAIQTTQHIGKK